MGTAAAVKAAAAAEEEEEEEEKEETEKKRKEKTQSVSSAVCSQSSQLGAIGSGGRPGRMRMSYSLLFSSDAANHFVSYIGFSHLHTDAPPTDRPTDLYFASHRISRLLHHTHAHAVERRGGNVNVTWT